MAALAKSTMAVNIRVMTRSRTTSWGQKGWPSTARSFLAARRSRSTWAASLLYSLRISLNDACWDAIFDTSVGLRDALDPHERDVQADERGRDDGQQHDVQDVHARQRLLRAVLLGEEEGAHDAAEDGRRR